MRFLDSKFILCVLLGHLQITISSAKGTNMITLLHQIDDQWQHAPKTETEECSDDHEVSTDLVMDLGEAMDGSKKGKFIMVDKEDYSKLFSHEDHAQINEFKMPIQINSQEGDCPLSNVAYDIVQHGLYFGKTHLNQFEMPVQQIDISLADIMIPPNNPYSKIALAEKRHHIASKFPIKSSKLTPIKQQTTQTTSAPVTILQFEQQKTWDTEEEPVAIKSVIPHQNTFKAKAEPEHQLLTARSSNRQTPHRSESSPKNSTLTNLGSGVFGERFDLGSSRGSGAGEGQRARNSLLRASEVARSLRMREQNSLATQMQAL